jgi:DNA-binding LytR/AlgR family response regulator
MIAVDIAWFLEEAGAEVIGPSGSIKDAMELLQSHTDGLDGAVLDINVRGERVFPVADVLARRRIPFVFTTGYDAMAVPEPYSSVRRFEKPIDYRVLIEALCKSFDH